MERMERRGDVERELRAAFSLVDQDKDGRISKQEIFRVVNGLGEKITERQFNCLMREADTNKDGFLNFEEFKALMKKYGCGKDDWTDGNHSLRSPFKFLSAWCLFTCSPSWYSLFSLLSTIVPSFSFWSISVVCPPVFFWSDVLGGCLHPGYDQEDSSSSPEPRYEKDLCSASSFHYGERVCGLEQRQHFNSSEATWPFLPRKSCHASTSASKIQLPDFVAILQNKIKNKLSPMYLRRLLPRACSTSSHYHVRGHNFPVPTVRSSRALKDFLPRSIILWNDLPPDIQALRTVASFKSALKKHLKL